MITSFFLNIWLDYRLALEVEEILDLLSHSGHDGGVEESIQTAEQESTDHDGDQNLDAGIDVTLHGNFMTKVLPSFSITAVNIVNSFLFLLEKI